MPRISTRLGRRNGRLLPAEKQAILGPFRDKQKRRHLQNYLLGLRKERPFFEALEKHLGVLRQKPPLLIYGAHDTGFKAGFFDKWKMLFPNHKAVLFSDAGHYLLEDIPAEYSKELREWLRTLPVQ